MSSKNDSKNTSMAAITHILGLLFGFLGPLAVYLVSDDQFVKDNAGNALVWQIFLTIYMIVAFISVFFFIGIVLIPILMISALVFPITAAVKASDGKTWKYPGTIDLFNTQETSQTADVQQEPSELEKSDVRTQPIADTEEELKEMYVEGEISDEEFDRQIERFEEQKYETEYN